MPTPTTLFGSARIGLNLQRSKDLFLQDPKDPRQGYEYSVPVRYALTVVVPIIVS